MKEIDVSVFKQFIKNIPQFIWWKDLDSKFLGCNDNVVSYFNLKSPDDIVGLTDFDLYNNKEDAESVRIMDQEVIHSRKPRLNYEECLEMPNLGKRWLSTSKIPLYDEDKNIIGTIGWFSDITDIKEMQIKLDESNQAIIDYSIQLKKANHKLQTANSDLERFAYVASHDLKSPVQTIKAYADLLKENESNSFSKDSKELIDFISDSTERMTALIDGILEYATTGTTNLALESVDINKVVSEKILDLEQYLDKKVDIKLDLPTQKISVYKDLIGVVFFNLIHNGLKFNVNAKPKVHCDYSENEEFWIFSVEDNGIGIDPRYEEEVFEPFKRLVGNSIEGSGIGLSTCQKIVSLHQGKIWLEKSAKDNTVFKFTISKHLK